jgi:hypothetical protein
MFEYAQAFKLLCLDEGWDWTLNTFSKILIAKCLEECNEVVSSEYELIDRKQTAQKLMSFYLYVQAFILSQMCSKNDSNLEIINTIKLYANILNKTMLEEDSQENTGLF